VTTALTWPQEGQRMKEPAVRIIALIRLAPQVDRDQLAAHLLEEGHEVLVLGVTDLNGF
jgi:hypothetical protein